jgi:hypothetical protein
VDLKQFAAQIEKWTSEPGVSVEWIIHADRHAVSPITSAAAAADSKQQHKQKEELPPPFYATLCQSLQKMGLSVEPEIFPAATDGRFVRLESEL